MPTGSPTVLDGLALLASVADDLVVSTARDTHVAISDRVTSPLRAVTGGGPRRRGVSDGVYAVVGWSLRTAGRGLDAVSATGLPAPGLESHRAGRFLTAAVNGLIGEELLESRPRLAIRMAVRRGARDVALDRESLGDAFPRATGRLAIFLHGLCEDETAWALHRETHGTTYGQALSARDWTPVYLRANTGLSLEANAETLAELVTELCAAWPVPVERIALIGHSQGGLVMRRAVAVPEAAPWVRSVTDLITLGTPHHGSHVARAATLGSKALQMLPETSAFGRWILDRRSAGIRDLDAGLSDDLVVPEQIRLHLVAASLGSLERGLIANGLGDLLVQPLSALGTARRRTPMVAHVSVHLVRSHHFTLLNHPEVRSALITWLDRPADQPSLTDGP